MIRIEKAPAYATIQDRGRRGFLASGFREPARWMSTRWHTLNALLGNDPGSARRSNGRLSGGEIVFDGSVDDSLSVEHREVTSAGQRRSSRGGRIMRRLVTIRLRSARRSRPVRLHRLRRRYRHSGDDEEPQHLRARRVRRHRRAAASSPATASRPDRRNGDVTRSAIRFPMSFRPPSIAQ